MKCQAEKPPYCDNNREKCSVKAGRAGFGRPLLCSGEHSRSISLILGQNARRGRQYAPPRLETPRNALKIGGLRAAFLLNTPSNFNYFLSKSLKSFSVVITLIDYLGPRNSLIVNSPATPSATKK